MTDLTLCAPREADEFIARMFSENSKCRLTVLEERAFKNGQSLDLGTITLHSGGGQPEKLLGAVQRGAFEWTLPDLLTAKSALSGLLGLGPDGDSNKLRRCLDAIAAIGVRTGLQHPRFDPHALEAMPFRRSTTVVADTSGVLQGGLDFVARYLHPAARVKIPAIVQMEIVNFAERFLSVRRTSRTRCPDLLIDHLLSQGGQRVLLKLELLADTEVERTFLLGDPLRSAFQRDVDPDVNDLSLSTAIRAYADRLIVEAARHHQAQANLGHRVQLLTSDQGLARMALAEGLQPLFFKAVAASDLFGRRLTGARLHPFNGQLCEIPISSILWELATAFGTAKIESDDGTHVLRITALGEDLAWSPYQSHGDLLWIDVTRTPEWKGPAPPIPSSPPPRLPPRAPRTKAAPRTKHAVPSTQRRSRGVTERESQEQTIPLHRFNVETLLLLVDALDNGQRLAEQDVVKIVGARNREGIGEYRRFLISAGAIQVSSGVWETLARARELAIAVRNEDIIGVRSVLLAEPSFAHFVRQLSEHGVGHAWDPSEFRRSVSTYLTLAEIIRVGAPISGEGFFATPSLPTLEDFARVALARFHELDRSDGLVATGAWLEALIRTDAIHPEIARLRLNDASAMKLLRRSTEGSTTDLRSDNHSIQVLRVQGGRPVVRTVHLYRGDYLIPGKSSTSLRIESPKP